MKKYRLKDPDMKGVVIASLAEKLVVIGNENSTDVELNNRYIYECLKDTKNLEAIYNRILVLPPSFYDNETILEMVGDGWPIDLGLVEEIPEEPKRVHMDRYEALRMVYEHGKKVAYGGNEWVFSHTYIYLRHGQLNTQGLNGIRSALDFGYDKKLWYVVEEN